MGVMVSSEHVLAFAAISFLLIVIPGPSVLFVIGRALAQGRRAALTTVVGNTLGACALVVAVALTSAALPGRRGRRLAMICLGVRAAATGRKD